MAKPVQGISAYCEGLKTPLAGLEFMGKNPMLWRYGVLPVAVNLLLTGLVLFAMIGACVYFAGDVHRKFDPSYWHRILEFLLIVFVVLMICSLTFAFWLTMQIVACGYFYGKLARQVEKLLGMKDEEMIEAPMVHQILDVSRETFSLILINILCLAIQFVPGIGTVLGIAGSGYFTCLALGREYWDYPLSLRGLRRKEKHEYARRHRMYTLGLGTAVMVLFMLPVVNAVLLTTAVTGTVLLHRKIAEK
jgi:uncharacterized protein involved in cysteine biosynthesis